jgi:hypothetical protein
MCSFFPGTDGMDTVSPPMSDATTQRLEVLADAAGQSSGI